ncbi:hypothetical protein AX17_007062 [Amanita inopinata Kibby_2008]|nr:hypothetical protein AX17_007062 [Amanita inopinata Kibby_2008]
MSASPPAPRRSQRDRKTVQPFNSAAAPSSVKRKRKRNETDHEEGVQNETEPEQELDDGHDAGDEEEDSVDEGDGAGEEYQSSKAAANKKGKGKATPKSKAAAPPTKKSRTAKVSHGPKPQKSGATRKSKKVKEGVTAPNAEQILVDANISNDNPLFNALVNSAMPLQSTAEDFIESLRQDSAIAQAELVNLILRSCGSNDTVDGDSALDYDGVVDALDNFTEVLKQENSPVYPLTSKLPAFKKFRKHLAEFMNRLVSASAELGLLYSTDLMATLQTWVIAMSSSQIRSFRHTATVIALELETALCDVAAAVEKEAEVVSRQREGEKKRKATNKSAGAARSKELETKAKEIRQRRKQIAEFLKEFVDGVFVHRYRDLDPNIRAECVRALGLWFKKYPGHFLDAAYLRYVGWVLSDSSTHVRLEAVRSLSGVYEQADFISSLNHFTERFKPRLIEMATLDMDVSVRVAVMQILAAIDGYSLLEDEEREKLCLLVFDEEPRVRKAVSGFVRGVWSEAVEERSLGRSGRRKPGAKDKERIGIKAIASLLVKWGKTLDHMFGDVSDSEDGNAEDEDEDVGRDEMDDSRYSRHLRRQKKQRKELVALLADGTGRTALVIEALWGEVEPVSDWEGLLDILLLDHSAAASSGDDEELPARPGSGRRANGRKRQTEEMGENGESEDVVIIDDAWRLEEVEEGLLLEVLVAAIRKAKADAASSKKVEEETVVNDITRALIKGLPRLFIKHQSDTNRIAEVLLIPTLMNLDLYLEMRMISSYAGLWDDVTKQFLSHSSLMVLARAVAAIRYFLDATSLSNTNGTKVSELEDELSSTLRDAVAGRDEIEVASFNEDEVLTLGTVCSRLSVLFGMRDMTAWMEEDEGGKQSSAWDIVSALSERGRLGYKEEETMVEYALQILTLHIMWKARGLTSTENPSPEEVKYREKLVEQRDGLLEKLTEYAIGSNSNTIESVKRSAFKNMLDLHVLFTAPQVDVDDEPMPIATVPLILDDETQYRCAGFIQAEIERYADLVADNQEDRLAEKDSGSDSERSHAEQQKAVTGKKQAGQGAKSAEKNSNVLSQAELEEEYVFIDLVTTFLRAIRTGTVHLRHGAVLLAHYGRLGHAFDACSKVVVDSLREEGLMYDNAEIVVEVVTHALQEAFNLVLDGVVQDDDNCVQLSKLLAGCFVLRGSQLSIIRRLEGHYVIRIHEILLGYVIKRLTAYEKNKNKKLFKTAMSFFRVMVPLLSKVKSKDALEIKTYMNQALAQAKLEPSPTAKVWEAQGAYEKRLSSAMSKDKRPKGRKGKKGAGGVTTTDESGVEKTATEDEAGTARESPPRPKPRRVTRAHPDVQAETETDTHEAPITNGNGPEVDDQLGPVTPKVAVRRKSAYRTRTPAKSKSPSRSPTHEPPEESPRLSPAVPSALGLQIGDMSDVELSVVTPKLSRKRQRTHDDRPEVDSIDRPVEDVVEQESPAGDLQIRRKRIRH